MKISLKKYFSLFQCISAVAFVKNETDILEQPCWVMLINIVAMDMLKSKIPPGKLHYKWCQVTAMRHFCR